MKPENPTPRKDNSTPVASKKPWKPLHLKVLDVPKNTNNAAGRLQPGEVINFYRNS